MAGDALALWERVWPAVVAGEAGAEPAADLDLAYLAWTVVLAWDDGVRLPGPDLEPSDVLRRVYEQRERRTEIDGGWCAIDYMVGGQLRDQGLLAQARALLTRAANRWDASQRQSFWVLAELGTVALLQNDWSVALAHVREAQSRCDGLPASEDPWEQREIEWFRVILPAKLGAIHRDLGNLELAETLLEDSWKRARALATAAAETIAAGDDIDALQGLARAWFWPVLERVTLAKRLADPAYLDEILAGAHASPLWEFVGAASRAQLRVHAAQLRAGLELTSEQARDALCAEFTSLAADSSLAPPERLSALVTTARLEIDAGRHEASATALTRARAALEAMGGERELGDAAWDVMALRVAESRRARLLARGSAELEEAERAFRPSWEAFLERWAEAPLQDSGLAFLYAAERRRTIDELVEITLAAHPLEVGHLRAFEQVVRAQALGTVGRRQRLDAPSLERLRRSLCAQGEGVLVYLPGQDVTHLFLFDAEELVYTRLASTSRIETAVRNWSRARAAERSRSTEASVEAGGAASHARSRRSARALAEELLPAAVVERIHGWSELRIAGLDAFGYLPFELLEPGAGPPLGVRVPISYLPSLPVGVWLAERPARDHGARRSDLLFVDATDPGRDLPAPFEMFERLELDTADVRSIAEFYAPELFEALVRGDATPAALERKVGGARSLHVFAHGVQDPGRTRPAGLLLRPSSDGRRVLWTEDLVRLDLPELVFLSACSAGSAPPRAGDDGANRLDVALLEQGVDVAILSWEPVRLRAGLELARAFHEGRRRHDLTPAAALQRARRASWERSGPTVQEPFLTHAVGVWRR